MNGREPLRGVLSAPLALGFSLLLTLCLSASALLVSQLWAWKPGTLVALSVLETVLYVGAAVALTRRYIGADLRQGLGLLRPKPLELLISAGLGVVLHVPAGYLDALVERRFPTPPERLIEQLQQLTPASPLHGALLLFGIAVLAPLAEELYFRGAMFGALRRGGPVFVATWTTSLAFVLAHQEPRMWAPLLLVALVLAMLRQHSSSIAPCLVLHAAFNATTLLAVFASRPTQPQTPDVPWTVALGGSALTVLGVWVFRRVAARQSLVRSTP